MHQDKIKIKRALLSVSDKQGIVEFARKLSQQDIEIISTGGTCKLLREANISVRDVSELTQFPEMMDGRVKTLHPKIHGGILGLRDTHEAIAKQHDIDWIDLVVVNLYPFAETIKKVDVTLDEAIENIDIGGPTMIRSAAKNMGWVGVVIDPSDYKNILDELDKYQGLTLATRQHLAAKAFTHTAAYDQLISDYLLKTVTLGQVAPVDTDTLTLQLKKVSDLRYGENPHQAASAYVFPDTLGILHAKQHQGKELSYNNIADADAAVACVREFLEPACVIVKHANPCGAAIANTIDVAFDQAYQADSLSAFGGIIAVNRKLTNEIAEKIAQIFCEVLIAPSYTQDALTILAAKPNLRVLELDMHHAQMSKEMKFVEGGLLIQEKNNSVMTLNELKIVTQAQPTEKELQTMLFAWRVVKHIKSNAILIARDNVTVGIGAGQVSRIDAVDLALKKAGASLVGAVLASDAFFPFRDSIDRLIGTGIKAIIQPCGANREKEIIEACNEQGIAMALTNQRCFKH